MKRTSNFMPNTELIAAENSSGNRAFPASDASPGRQSAVFEGPNVVIAGAPKSGTSSVFYWLRQHPEVLGPIKKETQFLMDRDSSTFRPALNYHDHGLAAYARYFDIAARTPAQKVVLEATPGYLYQQTALEVFARELPETRLVFILREPARRLLSVYHYFSQNRRDFDRRWSFGEFLERVQNGDPALAGNEYLREAIAHGQYIRYLRDWAGRCGRERLTVLLFEDLQRDPRAFMQGLCRALELDPAFFGPDFRFVKENHSYRVRWQGLHSWVVKIRHLLPAGAWRRRIKRIYHGLNTDAAKAAAPNPDESHYLLKMKALYQPANQELADFFALDLSAWH